MWEYEGDVVFEFLGELVNKTKTTEFAVAKFDGHDLLLIGSFDLAYYHEAEIFFEQAFYIEIYTMSLSNPKLSYATAEELARYTHLDIETDERLFAVSDDTLPNIVYFIGASNVKARKCLVHHSGEKMQIWEDALK